MHPTGGRSVSVVVQPETYGLESPFLDNFRMAVKVRSAEIQKQFHDGRGKRRVHRVQITRDQFGDFEESITRCDSGFLSP
jgi:hypothetical protein